MQDLDKQILKSPKNELYLLILSFSSNSQHIHNYRNECFSLDSIEIRFFSQTYRFPFEWITMWEFHDFLLLRCYVKSIFEVLEVQNLPLKHI